VLLQQSVCVSSQSPLYNNTRQEAIRTLGTTPACSHAHTIQKLHTLTMILPSSPCSKSSSSSAGAAAAPRAAACFTIFRLVPASSRSRGFPSISLGSPLPPLAMLLTDLPAVQHAQLPTSITGGKLLHIFQTGVRAQTRFVRYLHHLMEGGQLP